MASRVMRAVLFDMDGTLFDSEKLWDLALDELAARLGGRLSRTTRVAMIGSNLHSSVTMVHDDLGVVADAATSGRFLMDRIRYHFARGLTWQPGARELLRDVRTTGLATALVTSTHRDLVEVALRTIGPDCFDAVVCGDEVTHNKPHPESYLRAAELIDAEPAGCLAIEDSATGTASAQAAGCPVLVVPSEVPVPPAAGRLIRASLAGLTAEDLHAIHLRLSTGEVDVPDPAGT